MESESQTYDDLNIDTGTICSHDRPVVLSRASSLCVPVDPGVDPHGSLVRSLAGQVYYSAEV
jgi:hypothetical protein